MRYLMLLALVLLMSGCTRVSYNKTIDEAGNPVTTAIYTSILQRKTLDAQDGNGGRITYSTDSDAAVRLADVVSKAVIEAGKEGAMAASTSGASTIVP